MTSEKHTDYDNAHPSVRAKAQDLEYHASVLNEKMAVVEENSPIEEVRATVRNTDDHTLPVATFRAWFLGILFTVILSFVNQFFFFRKAPLLVGVLVVQLLSFPLGKLMARILPTREFRIFGKSFSLNPGPFNIKEHVIITATANAAASTAYAVDIVVIKRIFYGDDLGFFASFLLVITTQCLGYGLAGMCRRFLVRPAAMIWPSNLVNVALFRTLHEDEENSSGMTRIKFFMIAATGSFAYYFLPGYLATFLTTVSILCYAAPENKLLNQLGSGTRGLGMLSFSFDWNTIVSFLMSPLITPFWAQLNILFGFICVAWVLVPIGYYNNIWNAQTFPIFSSGIFRDNGSVYKPLDVMDPLTKALDETLYAEYGPLRISYFFAITYGIGFAALAAVLSHTVLYHGKEIKQRFQEARSSNDDIHCKLMDRYPEVPDWWYAAIFIVNMALAILVCEVYDIRLPWWGVILAVAMSALFILPIGMITAVTNQTLGLNIITEFVIGYILPGRPIANVTFKTYGYITMVQGITFTMDLKLGHYMKIPPRKMFLAQTVGTLVAALVNLGTAYMMFWLIPDICIQDGTWSCPNARVFYSASVIWGVIGPDKMFGPTSQYHALMWWFLIGFLLPIPVWLITRRFPNSWLQYIHVPVILGATAIMPPASSVMYPSWFILGFIFQFYIYRYHNAWWTKFNYVLSAAMDSGVAISAIAIFFIFQNNDIVLSWWGTEDDCPTFAKL